MIKIGNSDVLPKKKNVIPFPTLNLPQIITKHDY